MKDLIKKENLTLQELVDLDNYYFKNIDEFLSFDDDTIVNFRELVEKEGIKSLTKEELIIHLSTQGIYAKVLFESDEVDEYKKGYNLSKRLGLDYSDYSIGFANYYFNENNKEMALKYYKEAFAIGFDLNKYDYFYSLERFFTMQSINPAPYIRKMLDVIDIKDFSNDLIDTYLLMIVNLEKTNENYIKYIDEAIKYSKQLNEQCKIDNPYEYEDSDEARNLCELLTLKFEYYVIHKEFVKAFEVYEVLTKEIEDSQARRYYHSRDRYYEQMLYSLSKLHPEVNFVLEMKNEELMVVEDIEDINDYLHKVVTLQNQYGETFKFEIEFIYKGVSISLMPILPIIGNVLPFLLRNCCYILWQAEKGRCISETFRRDY